MKKKPNAGCETCVSCQPIGEGDHVCDEAMGQQSFVIEEYVPTDHYLWCNGRRYKSRG